MKTSRSIIDGAFRIFRSAFYGYGAWLLVVGWIFICASPVGLIAMTVDLSRKGGMAYLENLPPEKFSQWIAVLLLPVTLASIGFVMVALGRSDLLPLNSTTSE